MTSPVTHFSSPPDEPLPRDPEGGLEEPEETMELEEMEKRPEDSDEILDKILDGLGSLELRWRDLGVGGRPWSLRWKRGRQRTSKSGRTGNPSPARV